MPFKVILIVEDAPVTYEGKMYLPNERHPHFTCGICENQLQGTAPWIVFHNGQFEEALHIWCAAEYGNIAMVLGNPEVEMSDEYTPRHGHKALASNALKVVSS